MENPHVRVRHIFVYVYWSDSFDKSHKQIIKRFYYWMGNYSALENVPQ